MHLTCLVVDDSGAIRKIIRQMLEKLSFSVVEAADGREAIDVCRASQPDIIFLDWNMPVMGGLESLKILRTMPEGQRAKILFCTTETSTITISEAIQAGADEYIMKPFDQDIIESKLMEIGIDISQDQ